MTSPHDPNSYANTNDFQTEHVHFDWNLDFTKQIIHGQVVLTLNRVSTVADCLRLDSHHLKIEKCFNAESGKELDWSMIGTYDSKFGQALEIRLDSKAARFAVRIDYATTAVLKLDFKVAKISLLKLRFRLEMFRFTMA